MAPKPKPNQYADVAARIRAELWRDSWHQRLGERHRREWPSLWSELDRLADLVDDSPPPGSSAERLF